MTVKCLTKDGLVPVGLRMKSEHYEILRKYAFEKNITPNQAILQIAYERLGINLEVR